MRVDRLRVLRELREHAVTDLLGDRWTIRAPKSCTVLMEGWPFAPVHLVDNVQIDVLHSFQATADASLIVLRVPNVALKASVNEVLVDELRRVCGVFGPVRALG